MFDVLTMAAIADELAGVIVGGRIQRIGLVDPLTLAAEIYAGGHRHALVASAQPNDARLHLTRSLPSLDPALTPPLLLLLRKYVRNGVLVGIEQPPLERILRLSIAKRLDRHNERADREQDQIDGMETVDEALIAGADVELTYVHLVVEVMGRHSNVILVDDDGRIMASAKRVTPAMSRVRPVLPHQPYLPPPPLDRPDPRQMTAAGAAALLAAAPGEAELAQVIVRGLRGISPQMARELAFRTTGAVDTQVTVMPDDAVASLARETRALLEPLATGRWSPCIYRDGEDDDAEVVAYAAVPMRHLAAFYREAPVASISAAVELAAGATHQVSPRRHAQRRDRLAQSVAAERERVEHRLTALRQEQAKGEEAERLREAGELIYAWLWQIEPGQTVLDVDGVTVPLDPALSPKENAQAYFERYRKAKGATAQVPALVARADAELAYLDQLATQVSQAETFADLEGLTAEWARYGARPAGESDTKRGKPRRPKAPKRPAPLLDRYGNAIFIGRTGEQNDLVTFDLAGPDDTWLHARGVPGAHVIVRWRLPEAEDEATLTAAAALAAYYSAARGSGAVEVDLTKRRYVRKIKGGGPGLVTYRNERTISVRPQPEGEVSVLQKG